MTKLIFTLLFSFIALNGTAQDYEQRANKYYKYYNYEKARKDYIRALRKKRNNTELLSKIFNCYLEDNTLREEALPYINQLISLEPKDNKVKIQKAIALFHAHRFNEADSLLKTIEPLITSNDELLKQTATLKQAISNAKILTQIPLNISFINLGKGINTNRNEINPYIIASENKLFHASNKQYNPYDSIYYYNICISEMNKLHL